MLQPAAGEQWLGEARQLLFGSGNPTLPPARIAMTRLVVRRRPIRLRRPMLTVGLLLAATWWMCGFGGAVESSRPAIDAWRRTAQGWEHGYWTTLGKPPCNAPLHPAAFTTLLLMLAAMGFIQWHGCAAREAVVASSTDSLGCEPSRRLGPSAAGFWRENQVTALRTPHSAHCTPPARPAAPCRGDRHRRSSCPKPRLRERS